MKQQAIDAVRDKKWIKMAPMYFKNGEKEKGLALLARIEAANDGKHTTTVTVESSNSPDIPGNIAIDEVLLMKTSCRWKTTVTKTMIMNEQ